MSKKVFLKQVQEGSIIFNKPFGIEIYGIDYNKNFKFIFTIYCNDNECNNSYVEIDNKNTKVNNFYFYPIKNKSYEKYKVLVKIYEGENLIEEIFSPVLDYIEDFISINNVKLELIDNKLIASIEPNLELEKQDYAYYLDRDSDDALVMIWYSKSKTCTFDLLGPGNYSVRIFTRLIKNNDNRESIVLRTNVINVGE